VVCIDGLDSCMREFRLRHHLNGNVDVFVHALDLERFYLVDLTQIWDFGGGSVRLNTVCVKVGFGSLDKYMVDLIVEDDCPLGLCSVCGCWIVEDNFCGSENFCSKCMGVLEA